MRGMWLALALAGGCADPEPAHDTEAAVHAAEIRRLQSEIDELKAKMNATRPPGSSRDRVAFGSDVTVARGEVVDDVVTFGGDADIQGTVHGDVSTFGGDITIGPEGYVSGDANTFGGRIDVAEGGGIGGEAVGDDVTAGDDAPEVEAWSAWLSHRLVFLLSFAGAGVLVVGLFPKRLTRVAAALSEHPIRSFVVGAVAAAVLLSTSALLTLTLIGIPVALMLLAVLGWGWLVGFVGVCQALGDRLPFEQAHHGRWIAFLIGCLAITFFGALPWFGWLVLTAVTLAGLGAVFRR